MDRNGEKPLRDEEDDLTRISDRDLVDLCSEGSITAWNELYRRFTPLIRSIAGKHRIKHHYVEDVVQETYTEFAKMISQGKFDHSRGTPSALLSRIASYTCVDYYKKYHRERFEDDIDCHEWSSDTAQPSGERPDILLEKWDLIILVKDAVRRLKQVCRELIWLYYHEDLSYAEIVPILGRKEGALREQARRCRNTLRDMLESRGASLP